MKPESFQKACLLIHGFTATPDCMMIYKAPLEKNGFHVEAPLLSGHGSTVQDLRKTHWQDWYQCVSSKFDELEKKHTRISVIGLSLGGVLGLMLASEKKIDRLVLLATPIFLSGILARYVLPVVAGSPLEKIYPYQPKLAGPAINDPAQKQKFIHYTKMPIASIMEIVRFQKVVATRLKQITCPTLMIHSPLDTTAPFENMAYLKEHLGSPVIETLTLETSNHILTMDYERALVVERSMTFLNKEFSNTAR